MDIGPVLSLENIVPTTSSSLASIISNSWMNDDKEFIQHNRLLYISRLGPDFATNTMFRRRLGMENGQQELPLVDAKLSRLSIGRAGITDTIHFEQLHEPDAGPPKGFIDVKVQAVSLNAKDVYAISGRVETRNGTKALEFTGIVTAIGPDITDFKVGDHVLVCAPNHFSTTERVPSWQAHRLLPEEDLKTMATLPTAWGAALYALRDRAHLRPGESILVHSGAGAFGIAAISLAQRIGAVIYTTCGSASRREFLINQLGKLRCILRLSRNVLISVSSPFLGIPSTRIFSSRDDTFVEALNTATHGRGVDVVINSLVGDLMHASWRCVAAYGRFIEVGKKELLDAGRLEMDIFARSATFTAFDITEMLYHADEHYKSVYVKQVVLVLCYLIAFTNQLLHIV